MNDNCDERTVELFLSSNRIEIEDGGFTRRVMHRLPDRTVRLSRLWTAFCTVAAVLLLMTESVRTWLSGSLRGFIADISTNSMATQDPLLSIFLLSVAVSALSTAVLVRELR